MTPEEERAEKIANDRCHHSRFMSICIPCIAAEIRAAVEESHKDCCLLERAKAEDHGYTKAWDEADMKIAKAVEEAVLNQKRECAKHCEQQRLEGKAEAYADAARIADECQKRGVACSDIGGAIRARAAEVGK